MKNSAIGWTDVLKESSKWDWLEYRVTVMCICGRDIELYDADFDSTDGHVACKCGRIYGVRLVVKASEDSCSLWPRVGYTVPPILMVPSPQFEGTR